MRITIHPQGAEPLLLDLPSPPREGDTVLDLDHQQTYRVLHVRWLASSNPRDAAAVLDVILLDNP